MAIVAAGGLPHGIYERSQPRGNDFHSGRGVAHSHTRLLHSGGPTLHHHPRVQADHARGLCARAFRTLEQDVLPGRTCPRQCYLLGHQGDGARRDRRNRCGLFRRLHQCPSRAGTKPGAGHVAGSCFNLAVWPRHLRPRDCHWLGVGRAPACRRRCDRYGWRLSLCRAHGRGSRARNGSRRTCSDPCRNINRCGRLHRLRTRSGNIRCPRHCWSRCGACRRRPSGSGSGE